MYDKEYYSPDDLARLPWFPVRNAGTIRRLIQNGKLQAINVSATDTQPRWKIAKEDVIRYVASLKIN